MATNNVNLGIGLATGMFYTAPAGTALPTDASASLSSWTEVGAVTADGITWSTGKDSDPLRNWAKEVERLIASDEGGTVTAPLMYTTQKTLETIDDVIMLGTSKGVVREVGDISFSPTSAIVWEATIEAASWTLMKDDGQVTS